MNTVQLNINISYVTNLYAKIKNTGVMAKNCISLARYHDQLTHLKNKKIDEFHQHPEYNLWYSIC